MSTLPAPLAEPGARLAAAVLDGLLGLVVGVVPVLAGSGLLLGLLRGGADPRLSVVLLLLGYLLLPLLGLGAAAALYVWWPSTHDGATPGKQVVGIRAAGVDGDRLAAREHLVRLLGLYVEALASYLPTLVMVLARPDRRRVGDLLAGSVVVRSR